MIVHSINGRVISEFECLDFKDMLGRYQRGCVLFFVDAVFEKTVVPKPTHES